MLTRVIFLAAILIAAEGFVLAQKSGTTPDAEKGARSSDSGVEVLPKSRVMDSRKVMRFPLLIETRLSRANGKLVQLAAGLI